MEPTWRSWLRAGGICFGALVLAGATPPADPLGALEGALANAQAHTASLSVHAVNAPEGTLELPADDEYEAFAAVTAAEDALEEIERDARATLSAGGAIALRAAIVSAHEALGAYSRARMLSDRRAMEEASARAMSHLRHAGALVQAAQKPRRMR